MFDVRSGTWEKIQPQGEAPSPRAAHAGAAVGSMVVIQVTSDSTPLTIVATQSHVPNHSWRKVWDY